MVTSDQHVAKTEESCQSFDIVHINTHISTSPVRAGISTDHHPITDWILEQLDHSNYFPKNWKQLKNQLPRCQDG